MYHVRFEKMAQVMLRYNLHKKLDANYPWGFAGKSPVGFHESLPGDSAPDFAASIAADFEADSPVAPWRLT